MTIGPTCVYVFIAIQTATPGTWKSKRKFFFLTKLFLATIIEVNHMRNMQTTYFTVVTNELWCSVIPLKLKMIFTISFFRSFIRTTHQIRYFQFYFPNHKYVKVDIIHTLSNRRDWNKRKFTKLQQRAGQPGAWPRDRASEERRASGHQRAGIRSHQPPSWWWRQCHLEQCTSSFPWTWFRPLPEWSAWPVRSLPRWFRSRPRSWVSTAGESLEKGVKWALWDSGTYFCL